MLYIRDRQESPPVNLCCEGIHQGTCFFAGGVMHPDQVLTIAEKFWAYPPIPWTVGYAGVFFFLSKLYEQQGILRDSGPSAVFWLSRAGQCRAQRWSVTAIPWKGSKEKVGWWCLTWLPEKAGRVLQDAIVKTLQDREPSEAVVYQNTIGITFENSFWVVPVQVDEAMAIMRQRPFHPSIS